MVSFLKIENAYINKMSDQITTENIIKWIDEENYVNLASFSYEMIYNFHAETIFDKIINKNDFMAYLAMKEHISDEYKYEYYAAKKIPKGLIYCAVKQQLEHELLRTRIMYMTESEIKEEFEQVDADKFVENFTNNGIMCDSIIDLFKNFNKPRWMFKFIILAFLDTSELELIKQFVKKICE